MRSIIALGVFTLGLYLGALIGYRTAVRATEVTLSNAAYAADDQAQGTALEIANGRNQ